MNKLMIAAAAATLAVASQAGIVVNTNCNPHSATCPVVAFKVTANGKIAAPSKTGVYKTATKLQVKKGALVLFPEQVPGGAADDCCYSQYSLYLQAKVGKETYKVGVFSEEIDSWTIFGKSYNKAVDATKTKKFSVESEIGLGYANIQNGSAMQSQAAGNDNVSDDPLGDGGLGLADFAFIATAFGKGTYAYSYKVKKGGCTACSVDEGYEFIPGNYSGWFAGLVSDFGGDYGCLMCTCADLDVFGGTWKAKYDKTWSKSADGWEKAASYVFGSSMLAAMREEEIE